MNINSAKIAGFTAILLVVAGARADVFFNVNEDIPQGDLAGVSPAGSVSGLSGVISSVTLGLDITGGYNGDLYAYLEAPNGATVGLFDQPGVSGLDPFGYGGSGLDVTLSDTGTGQLQTAAETDGEVETGNFQATGSFASFNGLSPDGIWDLFVADVADGGGQAVLDNWSLDIATVPATVPEPGQVPAMMLLGLAGLSVGATRWLAKARIKNR